MGKKKDKKGRKSKNNQLSAEKQFQTEIPLSPFFYLL
jgi:hypothetical protein